MSEVLLALTVAVILGLILLLWKAFSCLQALAGVSTRSRDRERQDMFRLVEHHLDREMVMKTNPQATVSVAQMHQAETAHERETAAGVEKVELSASETLDKQKSSRVSKDALFSSVPDEPFGGVHS